MNRILRVRPKITEQLVVGMQSSKAKESWFEIQMQVSCFLFSSWFAHSFVVHLIPPHHLIGSSLSSPSSSSRCGTYAASTRSPKHARFVFYPFPHALSHLSDVHLLHQSATHVGLDLITAKRTVNLPLTLFCCSVRLWSLSLHGAAFHLSYFSLLSHPLTRSRPLLLCLACSCLRCNLHTLHSRCPVRF